MTQEQRDAHNEAALRAYQKERGLEGDELPWGDEEE